MTIEIDLPPDVEDRPRAEAARLGITPEELAARLIFADQPDMNEREETA